MKLDAKMMLLRLEYPLWNDEDLMRRIKDKEWSERKVCNHKRFDGLGSYWMVFHCDNCGKRY